ncbi:hypothetical protein BIV23_01870 [Streptomyces monashensis]|uniref:Uncharacterized protein n=1 Tax=Streptomyces monashensis TaxID=1678012 RepID=A0A1S2QNL2_9ACTN|nr:hypothetical protein BIV23_01870 [Streptomyces monashensis]
MQKVFDELPASGRLLGFRARSCPSAKASTACSTAVSTRSVAADGSVGHTARVADRYLRTGIRSPWPASAARSPWARGASRSWRVSRRPVAQTSVRMRAQSVSSSSVISHAITRFPPAR